MTKLHIRAASPADAESAAQLCKESLAETYGHFLSSEAMHPWIEGGRTDEYVRDNITNMLIAEDDGRVIGVCVLKEDLVDLMWVDRDRQGQGVGGSLIAEAERRIRLKGFTTGRVECFSLNTAAIAFYESHGYHAQRSFHDPVADTDKVEMYKAL